MTRRSMAMLLVLLFTRGAAADEPAPFPRPITSGEIQVTPRLARVGKLPLTSAAGKTQSKSEVFYLALMLANQSTTKRVIFRGWPHRDADEANFTVKDEHGNEYRPVGFDGARPVADEVDKAIDPGAKRVAVVVAEKPIDAATTLVVDLDGEAVGLKGQRLRWQIKRADWETGSR